MRNQPSLRANGSRECAPDDRLREAIRGAAEVGSANKPTAVIPGRCEASNPESRDSPMRNCASEVWSFGPSRNDSREAEARTRRSLRLPRHLRALNKTSTKPAAYGERFVKRRGLFCMTVASRCRFQVA
jgi:hypothetical protein